MTHRPTLLQDVEQAFYNRGVIAALTASIGGIVALLASVTRRAFTNDAMLGASRQGAATESSRVDRQRAEDRATEAQRLESIETDIRAMRNLIFEAFQRDRSD